MPETRVPVGRLKARLSEYLRRVKLGEPVVVTERGVAVATIQPIDPAQARTSRLAELRRAGLVREPRKKLGREFFSAERPKDPEGRSLDASLEERAEGH